MTTLLIDGDLIAYRRCAAAEKVDDWGDQISASVDVKQVRLDLKTEIEKLVEKLKGDRIVLGFTTSPNFRTKLYPAYKSNRKGVRKPLALERIRDWLKTEYKVVELPGIEGDDILGIFATRIKDSIIVSEDKDFQGVPCKLYRAGKLETISLEQADHFHLLQTLIGDTADGYPGCPGIGPVLAEKALARLSGRDAWLAVRSLFASKLHDTVLAASEALIQARCAFILRDNHWDVEQKSPILWSPPPLL